MSKQDDECIYKLGGRCARALCRNTGNVCNVTDPSECILFESRFIAPDDNIEITPTETPDTRLD